MKNTMTYRGYAARVDFDDDDGILVGRIVGIRDGVGFHADNVMDLQTAFHEAVDDYIETCARIGKDPQKPFSGNVMFRIAPEVHRRAALAAELAGKSLNQWAEEALRRAAEPWPDRSGSPFLDSSNGNPMPTTARQNISRLPGEETWPLRAWNGGREQRGNVAATGGRMPSTTLARLKDNLVDLYGEDQLAFYVAWAARQHVDGILKGGKTKANNRLWFGRGDPNDPGAIANYSLTFAELLAQSDPKGQHARIARTRLIVFAFALWENVYRPAIKRECGVDSVDSNAFGDLRLYRNAILHNKRRLDMVPVALTVFGKGDCIEPTADQLREVFRQLVAALNNLGVRYYGENPGFEWGRKLNA